MTPTQIAAIKGMLAYFDSGNNIPVDKAVIKGNCAEVAALRAALAEPAPVQEPVGWSMTYNGSHVGNVYESRAYAEERMADLNSKHPGDTRTIEPLYTAPQAQQPAPPADVPMLTDEELSAIYKQANGEDVGKAQPLTTQRIFKAMRAASVRQKAGLT